MNKELKYLLTYYATGIATLGLGYFTWNVLDFESSSVFVYALEILIMIALYITGVVVLLITLDRHVRNESVYEIFHLGPLDFTLWKLTLVRMLFSYTGTRDFVDGERVYFHRTQKYGVISKGDDKLTESTYVKFDDDVQYNKLIESEHISYLFKSNAD